jgi:hypothetical protein
VLDRLVVWLPLKRTHVRIAHRMRKEQPPNRPPSVRRQIIRLARLDSLRINGLVAVRDKKASAGALYEIRSTLGP